MGAYMHHPNFLTEERNFWLKLSCTHEKKIFWIHFKMFDSSKKKKKNEKCCNLQEDQQNDKSQRGSHFCLSFTIFDDQTIQINITIWNIKREMRALSARGRIQRFYALEMCSRVDWITNFNIRRTEITPFLPIAKAWGRAYVKGYITKCVEVIGQSAMDTRQQKQY